jgi:hypothetical protein
MHHGGDPDGRLDHVLVLPHPHGQPTLLPQPPVGVSIALAVSLELVPPPVRVRSREGGVLRTQVPEAPVDEDGDLRGTEDDVGPSAHAREDRPLDAVAQPGCVQGTAQRDLRARVPPPLLLHPAADDGRRGGRFGHQTWEKVVSYSLAIRTIMLP